MWYWIKETNEYGWIREVGYWIVRLAWVIERFGEWVQKKR